MATSQSKKRPLRDEDRPLNLTEDSDSDGGASSKPSGDNLVAEGVFHTQPFSIREHRSATTGEIRCVVHLGGRVAPVAKIVCTVAGGRRYAHVKSVSVAEGFRGRGLGQLLFKELFSIICALGVPEVRLEAEEDTRRHNHLVHYYEGMGFRLREGVKVLYLNNYDEYYRKVPMYRPLRPEAPYLRLHGEGSFLLIRFQTHRGRFIAASSDGSVCAAEDDAAAAAAEAAAAATVDSEAVAASAAATSDGGNNGGGSSSSGSGGSSSSGISTAMAAAATAHDSLSAQWVLIQEDSAIVCFESAYGKFLCAEPDGKVIADRCWDSSWEHFWIEPYTAAEDATAAANATTNAATAANAATIADAAAAGASSSAVSKSAAAPGPRTEVDLFTLRTFHGHYLCLDDAERTIATSSRPVVWRADRTRGICQCDGAAAGVAMRAASARQVALQAHLSEMRRRQTVAFATGMRDRCLATLRPGGPRGAMTVRAAVERLQRLRDPHQKATADAARLLLLTADDLRAAGQPDWMQLIGLLHGLGRVLCTFSEPQNGVTDEERACGLAEYAWVVGAPMPPRIVAPTYNAGNADLADPRCQRQPAGMYEPGCGLDAVALTWTGPEYLWHVLRHNGCDGRLPPEAMAMLRYWPLEAWHAGGAYAALEAADGRDAAMRAGVQKFDAARRATLRSVTHRRRSANWEAAWAHLQPIVDKYAPGELQW